MGGSPGPATVVATAAAGCGDKCTVGVGAPGYSSAQAPKLVGGEVLLTETSSRLSFQPTAPSSMSSSLSGSGIQYVKRVEKSEAWTLDSADGGFPPPLSFIFLLDSFLFNVAWNAYLGSESASYRRWETGEGGSIRWPGSGTDTTVPATLPK